MSALRLLCRALLAVLALSAGCASAQQLHLMVGATTRLHFGDDTFSYMLDYSRRSGKHLSWSLAYMNEGHLVDHHRDGVAAQAWLGTDLTPGWSVKAGAGPYLYFDTASRLVPGGYVDHHGVGTILSLATEWRFAERWSLQVRANRIYTRNNIDTDSVLVGIGYMLDDAPRVGVGAFDATPRHELTVYLGKTVVNDFESETAFAQSLEYRRTVSRHFQWAVSVLNEGDPGPVDRYGVLAQVWATRPLFGERSTIGVGIGPYLTRDNGDDHSQRLLGVLSLTVAYQFSSSWSARATWHRVITDYDRDTDVVLIGAGYRW